MQLSRDHAVTRRITLYLWIAMYTESLNPTLHISPPSLVGKALDWQSKGRRFESAVNDFFLPTMFACLHTSVQVKTHTQNEWSVTNQIEYTGFRQDSYL